MKRTIRLVDPLILRILGRARPSLGHCQLPSTTHWLSTRPFLNTKTEKKLSVCWSVCCFGVPRACLFYHLVGLSCFSSRSVAYYRKSAVFYYANTQTNLQENGMKKCVFMRDVRFPCPKEMPCRAFSSMLHNSFNSLTGLSCAYTQLRACMSFSP
jgi:hypothetical protein